VFGIRRIREERNWGERDRREIAHFFSLADKRNKRERESLNTWGPHISDSPQNCEEIAERDLFPILSSLQTTRKRKNILNRNKIKVKHRIKNGLLGL
jgi:DNA primase catalytic subunit